MTKYFSRTEENRDLLLQMAVKFMNDTTEPYGLTLTLLVFGTFPRIRKLDPPATSILNRVEAIGKATL